MQSFQDRLALLGTSVIWLNAAEAFAAFRYAGLCFDESRYGLNKTGFNYIERLDVDVPVEEVRAWLEQRIGRGPELIRVVYTRDDVCEIPARLFLNHWQSHVCPANDDLVVLPPQGGWVLGYFHGDQFEFARGGPAAPGTSLTHEGP